MKIKRFIWPITIVILVILAYVLYDKANQIHQSQALRPPSLHHLLGTDDLGRDFLTRLFVGSLITLGLTAFIMIGTIVLGLIIGLISAIVGKWLDSIIMALADMLIALPAIIIALVVLGFINNSVVGLCLALIIGWLGRYLRYFRNLARDTMTQPFIKFAPLSGLGVKPPIPELGAILHDGKSYFYSAPWLFIFPGVLLGGFALICQILNRRHLH